MDRDINSAMIEKAIDKMNKVVRQLNTVFQAVEKDDPFIEIEYEEVLQFKEELLRLLKDYKYMMHEYEEGNIGFVFDGETVQANPSAYRSGENAPAYKKSIDEALLYKFWLNGVSLREIARRVGCSPDTVKRRISKIEHRIERGGKI